MFEWDFRLSGFYIFINFNIFRQIRFFITVFNINLDLNMKSATFKIVMDRLR